MGYVREDGRVGTRNFIGLLSSVNCSATVIRQIAAHFNLDGVKAAYRAVIDGWPGDQSLVAAGDLVQHLSEAGDLAGAREVSHSVGAPNATSGTPSG